MLTRIIHQSPQLVTFFESKVKTPLTTIGRSLRPPAQTRRALENARPSSPGQAGLALPRRRKEGGFVGGEAAHKNLSFACEERAFVNRLN